MVFTAEHQYKCNGYYYCLTLYVCTYSYIQKEKQVFQIIRTHALALHDGIEL